MSVVYAVWVSLEWCLGMESNPDTEIFNPLLYRLSFLGFNGCRIYEVSARPENNRSPMTQGCIKEASMRRFQLERF